MSQKGFTHLILLLVIGIVFMSGYALYKKEHVNLYPNKDSNWKTYTNSDLKFIFQYPSNWKVEEMPFNTSTLTSPDFQSMEDTYGYTQAKTGAKMRFDNLLDKNASYFSDKEYPCIDCSGEDEKPLVRNLVIDQYPAIEKKFNNKITVQIEKDTTYYSLSMIYASSEYLEVFNYLVSTFKFTN